MEPRAKEKATLANIFDPHVVMMRLLYFTLLYVAPIVHYKECVGDGSD